MNSNHTNFRTNVYSSPDKELTAECEIETKTNRHIVAVIVVIIVVGVVVVVVVAVVVVTLDPNCTVCRLYLLTTTMASSYTTFDTTTRVTRSGGRLKWVEGGGGNWEAIGVVVVC